MKECPETQIKNTRRNLHRLDAEKPYRAIYGQSWYDNCN